MKICPDCNKELIAIDSKGMFSFQKRASRMLWLFLVIFLVLLWSILIPKLMPEDLVSVSLVVYYITALIFILKTYKLNKSKIIYECLNCKNKFSDNPLKPFDYGK